MTLPEDQTAILRHALGLTSRPDPHRNSFAAELESPDGRDCLSLTAAGLMTQGRSIEGGLVYFHVTIAGIRAVWGKAATYEPTGDEVTARETDKKVRMLWHAADKGRFRTGDVYRVNKSTVRFL